MKLRYGFVFLACTALVAAGCGGDGKDSKDGGDDKASSKKLSKTEQAVQDDRDNKETQVSAAEKAFKKDDKDPGACRNLAMSYVALASPASTGDVKNPPPVPKDRDENLKKAVTTLEECAKLDGTDRSVKQMLASTYMATNKYDKAAALNKELATTAKGDEAPNAYYAWGLAASNAQQYDDAIAAWQKFITLSPPKDPRIVQVKQSIKALQTQLANAKKAAATAPAADADAEADADSEDKGDEG